MKLIFILSFIVLLSGQIFAQSIIPEPTKYLQNQDFFKYENEVRIVYESPDLEEEVKYFIESNRKFTDVICYVGSENAERPVVELILNEDLKDMDGGYLLDVKPDKIELKSDSEEGIFCGMQSILMMFISESDKKIACCSIKDQPRFNWRGLMLDESRYFFGKQKVKQLLDYMALLKLNKFHWHLTDSPGWRIEIKQYPKLTEVGAVGVHFDRKSPAVFYTQKDIKEVIQYAKDRYIEIIPEIDMPGHATAANRAYPEFSGGGSEKYPDFTFNPADEATFEYLSNILDEVGSLFPSKYLHIGGDEVHFGNKQWNDLPEVQKLMKKHKMETLKDVEDHFVRKVSKQLQQNNKIMIGWDEIAGSNVNVDHSVVMWWRHNMPDQLNIALEKGYQTVLCPRLPLYFDFDQHESHQYGRRWGGFCDLESLYNYPNREAEQVDKYTDQILGLQACVWTERIQSEKRLDYLIFPRIFALSEAGWAGGETKSYQQFLNRLEKFMPFLDQSGLYFFNPFNPETTPEPYGRIP